MDYIVFKSYCKRFWITSGGLSTIIGSLSCPTLAASDLLVVCRQSHPVQINVTGKLHHSCCLKHIFCLSSIPI